jgi:hypothetical protein
LQYPKFGKKFSKRLAILVEFTLEKHMKIKKESKASFSIVSYPMELIVELR